MMDMSRMETLYGEVGPDGRVLPGTAHKRTRLSLSIIGTAVVLVGAPDVILI